MKLSGDHWSEAFPDKDQMLKWRCIQADGERHCTRSCMAAHAWAAPLFHTNTQLDTLMWTQKTDTQMKNKDTPSIQTAAALRSEAAEGLDAKRLSFHDNYPYREKACCFQTLFAFMCFCVYVWEMGGGVFMQHSSSLSRPRPHIIADLTVSDRTSPFSAPPSPPLTSPGWTLSSIVFWFWQHGGSVGNNVASQQESCFLEGQGMFSFGLACHSFGSLIQSSTEAVV